MSSVVLNATGLAKRFGATVALADAGLVLRAGEIHALMGQNGAGKSTLIKLLTGVEIPDAGTIQLEGRRIAPATPLQAYKAPLHSDTPSRVPKMSWTSNGRNAMSNCRTNAIAPIIARTL